MLKVIFEDNTSQNDNSHFVGEFANVELAKKGIESHVAMNKHDGEILAFDVEDGHIDAAVGFGSWIRLYRTE